MTSLGIVWMIHWSSGSFGSAGIVTGGFALAEGGIGPQAARLIDRFGQVRVLPFSLAAHAVAVAVLITLAAAHSQLWILTGAGVLAGASIPQLGALTSARWAGLLTGSPLLPSAFALEALSNDIAYLAGPILVGTISVTIHPLAGSTLAVMLVVGGGCALIAQPRTAPPPAGHEPSRVNTGSLARRGFAVLVCVNVGIGLFFGAMQVSVTGFAVDHGAPDVAGPLYSISSCASLFAGVTFGLRRWRAAPPRQLACVLTLLAVGCIPLLIATSVPALAVALILPGLAIAPTLIVAALITEALVDSTVLTQAFTWLNSASAAGTAVAAALTGQLLDRHGARWSFAIALAATTSIAMLVWLNQGGIQGRSPGSTHRSPDAETP